MDSNLINISNIENFFSELLADKVSKNVFFTNLPNTIEGTWDNMVVVDCATAIQDMSAFGYGTINILLYGKPMSNGKKNLALFDEMERILNECVESNTDLRYKAKRGNTYTDYDEQRNLHCNIVSLILMIL